MAERVGLSDPIDAVFFQTVRKTKKNLYLFKPFRVLPRILLPTGFSRVRPVFPGLFPLNLQEGDNQLFSGGEDESAQADVTYGLEKSREHGTF